MVVQANRGFDPGLVRRIVTERRCVVAICRGDVFGGPGFPINRVLAAYDAVLGQFPIDPAARWVVGIGAIGSIGPPTLAAGLVRQRPEIRGLFLIEGTLFSLGRAMPQPTEWFQGRRQPFFLANARVWQTQPHASNLDWSDPKLGPLPAGMEVLDYVIGGRLSEADPAPWVMNTLDWLEFRTWMTVPVDAASATAVARFADRLLSSGDASPGDVLSEQVRIAGLAGLVKRWALPDPEGAPERFSGLAGRAAGVAASPEYRLAVEARQMLGQVKAAEGRATPGEAASPVHRQHLARQYGEIVRRYPGTPAAVEAAARAELLAATAAGSPAPATAGPGPVSSAGAAPVPIASPSAGLSPGQWVKVGVAYAGEQSRYLGTTFTLRALQFDLHIRLPAGSSPSVPHASVFLDGWWQRELFEAWADARSVVLIKSDPPPARDVETVVGTLDHLRKTPALWPEEFRVVVSSAGRAVSWEQLSPLRPLPAMSVSLFHAREVSPERFFGRDTQFPARTVPPRIVFAGGASRLDAATREAHIRAAGPRIRVDFGELTFTEDGRPTPASVQAVLDRLFDHALVEARPVPAQLPVAMAIIRARLGQVDEPTVPAIAAALTLDRLAESATRWKLGASPEGQQLTSRIAASLTERMKDPDAAREVGGRRALVRAEAYAAQELAPTKRPTRLVYQSAIRRYREVVSGFPGTLAASDAEAKAKALEPQA